MESIQNTSMSLSQDQAKEIAYLTQDYQNIRSKQNLFNLMKNIKNYSGDDYCRDMLPKILQTSSFEQAIEILKSNSPKSEICSAKIQHGQVSWQCEDCKIHPNSIICKDCFQNGDHQGHRVKRKTDSSGCCDCGDASFWNEKGNCKNHKGTKVDILGQMNNKHLQNLLKKAIRIQLFKIFLLVKSDPIASFPQDQQITLYRSQTKLLSILNDLNVYCIKITVSELAKDIQGNEISNPQENIRQTLIFKIIQRMYLMPKMIKKFINDIFYPLLKSLRFKILYGIAFTQCYERVCISSPCQNGVDGFHCQVYPIYQVSQAYGDNFIAKAFKLLKYVFLGKVDD